MPGRSTDPAAGSEQRFHRLELLGLANGVALIASLALVLLAPPWPWRLAGAAALLAFTACAVILRHRFWAVLNAELRRRKQTEQEARAAEIVKSRFLSDVSHEIRTPMNGILGLTELLLRDGLAPGQREKVELVRTSAESLLSLVGDILDLSRIEAGQLQLRLQDFRLRALVADVLRLLEPGAAERGVELGLHVDPTLPDDLHDDPVRLRQVLLNLVGNGIRFTRNGTVTVALEPLGTGDRAALLCEVRDTGVGIRPEVQSRLFRPYSQSESSVSRQSGGTGLGLVISKSIVEMMGGEIGFKSTYGVGSSFWFRIPLRPARSGLVQKRLAALGDGNLQAEVVRAFVVQGERDLAALRSALPENDAKAFAEAAHSLSGSSGVLGGPVLAELAAELASLARQGDLGGCAERLPALERELQAFLAELSA